MAAIWFINKKKDAPPSPPPETDTP
jgi:hypothetical protein